jgi:hypothetical protein
VLRVDRLHDAIAPQAVLDDLPVALVAAGPQDAAILSVVREQQPVLQPRSDPPAVDGGPRRSAAHAGHAPGERLHGGERGSLAAVMHDDGRVALERRGRRGGRGRGGRQEHRRGTQRTSSAGTSEAPEHGGG